MKYTFSGPAAHAKGETTVEASTEAEARSKAMEKRWGVRPWQWGANQPWIGAGLYLLSTQP